MDSLDGKRHALGRRVDRRSSGASTPLLFTPLTLRGLTLRNRIVLSPMCQYQAVEGRDAGLALPASRPLREPAASAPAFVEATGVTRDGRITHGCTGIWEDAQIPGLKRIVDLYRQLRRGLRHPDRPCRPARQRGPSVGRRGAAPASRAVPSPPGSASGRARCRSARAIRRRARSPTREIDGSGRGLRRRRQARACGRLRRSSKSTAPTAISSIRSSRRSRTGAPTRSAARSNKRMRFPLLVAEAVRAAWPADKPLFYRVSSVDGIEGGVTIEDTVALAQALKARGIDLIDCSSGGMSGAGDALARPRSRPATRCPTRRRCDRAPASADDGCRRDPRAAAGRGDPAGRATPT